ncbi:YccT family protein [Photobacterium indicum]|uniref:YccT family protein n=1 Tax=Photobacterium indicum TaxID=81447 RepID=UPI003D0E7304
MKMKSLGVAILLIFGSGQAVADTVLTLQPEINPIIVNGGKAGNGIFSPEQQVDVQKGENQILITVGQIVFEDAKRRKYNSPSYILKFNANDQPLSLTYDKMRTIQEAKAFEKSPSFVFTDVNGKNINYKIDVLNASGMQSFRDYQQELQAYNQGQEGRAAVSISTASVGYTAIDPQSVAPNPAAKMTFLHNTFRDLSADEQQQFMQWAMKNLK